MAVAPQLAAFKIADLRSVRAHALTELLAEEERVWSERLFWDYRPSAEMIARHVDARTLSGVVALRAGRVAGYCFYVIEEQKGLIGDLYVLERHQQERFGPEGKGIASQLLENVLTALERSPRVARIEGQLITWGVEPVAPLFWARGFRSFPRLFLYKELGPGASSSSPLQLPGVRVHAWDDRYFEAMADLVVACYRYHIDSQINDQYSQRAGALRFLKNIVIFPGCGIFQPEGSLVAVEEASQRLVGAVLTSRVAPGIAHVTQVCVLDEWRRRRLGRALMNGALDLLRLRGHRGVSLTVTAANQPAVRLYHQMGFRILKGFSAFAHSPR